MKFKRGQSGNPKGRPRGRGEVAAIREKLAANLQEIIDQLIDKAKGGDMQAIRLLLDRTVPTLRADDNAIEVDLPTDGTLSDQGEAIIRAAALGKITPAQASAMTNALAGVARIKEVSELEERIRKLEEDRETKPE